MNRNSKYYRLIKDTIVFGIGNLGSKLILFLLVPLYTNYMTKAEYGIADLVSSLSELILPFVSLVIFDAVQRFAFSKHEKREDVLLGGLLICLAGTLSMIAITPLVALYNTITEWRWYLSIYVILTMYANVERNYLKALDKNLLFSSLSILQAIVLASLNIVFLCYGRMGVRGYLISMCISQAVTVVGAFVFGGLPKELRRSEYNSDLIKRMLIYSFPLIFNNISWWAIHSFDKVVLERLLGATALGMYTVASKMPSLVNVMTSIFSQAWGISAVREYESENEIEYYSSVFSILQVIIFGVCIVITMTIKLFMNYYVGPQFLESWRYVPLLVVAASFYSLGSFFASLYGVLMKSINNMVTTIISSSICIIMTLIMIPRVGVWGAVVGTYAAYIVIMIIRMLDVKRYIDVNVGGYKFIINVLIVTIQALLVSFEIYNSLIVSTIAVVLMIYNNNSTINIMIKSSLLRKE